MDFPFNEECISSSPEETMQLGEKLGGILKPGNIVALKGKLGAGKTVFAKGIAKALGVNEELTSPSYTIISEYEGKESPVYHMDAYRLSGEEDFFLAGGEELLYDSGVCIIEWAERIRLPDSSFCVEIKMMENGKRRIFYGDDR